MDQIQVEYREIPGFPGYRAGSDGTIWGCRNKKGRITGNWKIRKLHPNKGYLDVVLYEGGKRFYFRVGVLVLMSFVGHRPKEGMECCHENGVRTDNRPSNLRWDTRVNNQADRLKHGTAIYGVRNSTAKLSDRSLQEVLLLLKQGRQQTEIAKLFGVSKGAINHIVKGRNWVRRLKELNDGRDERSLLSAVGYP